MHSIPKVTGFVMNVSLGDALKFLAFVVLERTAHSLGCWSTWTAFLRYALFAPGRLQLCSNRTQSLT